MTLQVHLTDRYVYLCENRPPKYGRDICLVSNFMGDLIPDFFDFADSIFPKPYISGKIIATNKNIDISPRTEFGKLKSNLSQSDADYIRSNGFKEVEVEDDVKVIRQNDNRSVSVGLSEYPKLDPDGNVILVREKPTMFPLRSDSKNRLIAGALCCVCHDICNDWNMPYKKQVICKKCAAKKGFIQPNQ